MLQNISFTLSEGIEEIKTEKIRKKIRRKERGFRMEWVNSILVIPAPSWPVRRLHCRLRMQSVTRHCKERLYVESPRKKNWGMQASTVHCADESIQGYSGEVR